jgi:hypothetical protein
VLRTARFADARVESVVISCPNGIRQERIGVVPALLALTCAATSSRSWAASGGTPPSPAFAMAFNVVSMAPAHASPQPSTQHRIGSPEHRRRCTRTVQCDRTHLSSCARARAVARVRARTIRYQQLRWVAHDRKLESMFPLCGSVVRLRLRRGHMLIVSRLQSESGTRSTCVLELGRPGDGQSM